MNILAVCGSKRKNGNTSILIDRALSTFKDQENINIDTLYQGDMQFEGCTGCEGCAHTNSCILDDDMQKAYGLIRRADALIAGSPTYFYNMTSLMKKFIERCYCFTSYGSENRAVWISELDNLPRKYAGYISICEQNSIDDMGFTAEAMEKAFASLGFRTVFSMKVLHCFHKGAVNTFPEIISEAEKSGIKLKQTVELHQLL